MIATQIGETEQRIKEIEQGSLLDREITRLDHFKQLDTTSARHGDALTAFRMLRGGDPIPATCSRLSACQVREQARRRE